MKKVKYQILYLNKDERRAHNNKPTYWTPEKPHGCLEHMITSPDYIVREFTGTCDIDGKEIYEGDKITKYTKYGKRNGTFDYYISRTTEKVVEYQNTKNYAGYNVSGKVKYKITGNIYKIKI